jgi:arylformamidase
MLADPSRLVRLSYDLGEDTPPYGNNAPITLSQMRRIRAGDPSNSRFFDGPLHSGTHVDAPRHFSDEMPSLTDLPADAFFFRRPAIVDVPKDDGELVSPGDLEPHAAAIAPCDLLAVRTGFGRHRSADRERYSKRGPGFHPDAASWLLENAPSLRALAMDTVSAASFLHRQEGIEFHRHMLGRKRGDRFVLLVEDVNLAAWTEPLAEAWIAPIFIRDGDGAPCTIYGVRA